MKKIALWVMLLLTVSFGLGMKALATDTGTPVPERPKHVGLGIILGAPTGLTGKVWIDKINAWDFALGSFGYEAGPGYGFYGFVAHADYLWHRYGVFGEKGSYGAQRVPLYLGVGGVIASPVMVGVRGVAGVTYISDQPFDFFVEAAPTLGAFNGYMAFGIDFGLGGRFYF
jgi:hypothetical protein